MSLKFTFSAFYVSDVYASRIHLSRSAPRRNYKPKIGWDVITAIHDKMLEFTLMTAELI